MANALANFRQIYPGCRNVEQNEVPIGFEKLEGQPIKYNPVSSLTEGKATRAQTLSGNIEPVQGKDVRNIPFLWDMGSCRQPQDV